MEHKIFLEDMDEPTIIDFWAEWCGPCKQFMPIFEDAESRHGGVRFLKINIDENMELCKSLGIMSIPTIHLYQYKMLLAEHNGGLDPSQLDNFIEDNLL